MNHKICRLALCVLSLFGVFSTEGCGKEQKVEKKFSKQPVVIDDFDKSPSPNLA